MKQPRSAKRAAALAMMNDSDRLRFGQLCGEPTAAGCVPWLGSKETDGYGRFTVRNVVVSAHRASFAFAHGRQPDTVRHDCDNPACVNADHLREGTQLDNIADRHVRGRDGAAHGETNGAAKLCRFTVDLIRSSALSSPKLAALFGVGLCTIKDVRYDKTWRENCAQPMPSGEAT